jgi:alpha-methylacyl-CoA racemase
MSQSAAGPLKGKRIIELAGLGPAPYCGQLLADLGAEVILVDRPNAIRLPVENRGKKSIAIDLRKPESAEIVLRLIEDADALIEGLRPGVTERLGIGPEACRARNPKLVYGRMTGWGQDGPMASMAGHDINYLSITGALYAMGSADQVPPPPLNLLGDFGGGSMFLALGVVSAIHAASQTGQGDVVDAAIVDGVSSTMGMIRSFESFGGWTTERQANMLDGAAPYYRCYLTQDGQYMAVGCIEPQFFIIMVDKLGIDSAQYGDQNDRAAWAAQTQLLEDIFAGQTRDHWSALFDNTDACITPVLNYQEALAHPQNTARQSHIIDRSISHPNRAPRFASTNEHAPRLDCPTVGQQTSEILESAGFDASEIDSFIQEKTVF